MCMGGWGYCETVCEKVELGVCASLEYPHKELCARYKTGIHQSRASHNKTFRMPNMYAIKCFQRVGNLPFFKPSLMYNLFNTVYEVFHCASPVLLVKQNLLRL